MGEARRLWNLGLTDKRTHNKLIIRIWASNKVSADLVFLLSGLHEEYELRYIREDNYFTKQQE